MGKHWGQSLELRYWEELVGGLVCCRGGSPGRCGSARGGSAARAFDRVPEAGLSRARKGPTYRQTPGADTISGIPPVHVATQSRLELDSVSVLRLHGGISLRSSDCVMHPAEVARRRTRQRRRKHINNGGRGIREEPPDGGRAVGRLDTDLTRHRRLCKTRVRRVANDGKAD
jgi:hypothetical protein